MHYVCIEDNKISAILNYEPAVPATVTLVTISDDDAANLRAETHLFNLDTRTVQPISSSLASQKAIELQNGQEREFLNNTDWKVLRHIRQKALNIATSLTDAQYLELETQRESAAARIV